MVVAVGLTVCVPPLAGSEYLVESKLSVMTTAVAFVAVTVSVLICPALIDVGFAPIVTVGPPTTAVTVTVACAVAVALPLPLTVIA
jgi:hypothetical protein